MDWFQAIFGFKEGDYEETRGQFALERGGEVLVSRETGEHFEVGPFEYPRVEELRKKALNNDADLAGLGGLTFHNVAGDVVALHKAPENSGAVFQVASQFNCLEMTGPTRCPENGVTCYALDKTQGPACALSCPAGTVFRNYFVNEKGQAGEHQLDLLADVGKLLGNGRRKYWVMQNGYCLPWTATSVARLSKRLDSEPDLVNLVRRRLRVGVHWATSVAGCEHRVCQVFCSALPVAYAPYAVPEGWETFATSVLRAAYEGTLWAAAKLAREKGARVTTYLTALGGGAFGNRTEWIITALERALQALRHEPLDVRLVHYMRIPEGVFDGLEARFAEPSTPKKRPAADAAGEEEAAECQELSRGASATQARKRPAAAAAGR